MAKFVGPQFPISRSLKRARTTDGTDDGVLLEGSRHDSLLLDLMDATTAAQQHLRAKFSETVASIKGDADLQRCWPGEEGGSFTRPSPSIPPRLGYRVR
jgi:hypothetical protein